MAQVFPTKGNLLLLQKSLKQSEVGYDLLDKKRNILILEMMQLMDKARILNVNVDAAYKVAYQNLQRANTRNGMVLEAASATPIDNSLEITYHSVMGVDIPVVTAADIEPHPYYGIHSTGSAVDETYLSFLEVRKYTLLLAEVENSIYRLAKAIRSTQRRANSLKNVMIPEYKKSVKYISNYLEEKDREEFSRLKVIKSTQEASE